MIMETKQVEPLISITMLVDSAKRVMFSGDSAKGNGWG